MQRQQFVTETRSRGQKGILRSTQGQELYIVYINDKNTRAQRTQSSMRIDIRRYVKKKGKEDKKKVAAPFMRSYIHTRTFFIYYKSIPN